MPQDALEYVDVLFSLVVLFNTLNLALLMIRGENV